LTEISAHGLNITIFFSLFRYTAENSVQRGAPRNTDHPEFRQPLAFEVWQSIKEQLDPSEKITILTNEPLTNVVNIMLSDNRATSFIEVSCLISNFLFYAVLSVF
jgi:hypothetical protein